jgi:hypothetical protein
LEANLSIAEFNIFPNPSTGIVSFAVKSNSAMGMINIQISSLDGKVIKEIVTKETQQTVDLSYFSAEIYSVNFVSGSDKKNSIIDAYRLIFFLSYSLHKQRWISCQDQEEIDPFQGHIFIAT